MAKAKKKPIDHRPKKVTQEKEPTISFDSREFAHHNKNSLWYLGIGLLLLAGLALALGARNYSFSLVVIAAGIAIFRLAHLRPGSRTITLAPRGLTWGDKFFGYHHFKAFWISEASGQVTAYLEQPNFAPVIHFEIPDDKVEDTLTVLSLELPFHEHKDEPISDRVARMLRI